jgi:hypothetical protein
MMIFNHVVVVDYYVFIIYSHSIPSGLVSIENKKYILWIIKNSGKSISQN